MLNRFWRIRLITGVLAVVLAAPAAVLLGSDQGHPVTHSAPADIDEWVQRAMKTFNVPGLALTIVKDGSVLVAKGYGVRKLSDQTPVDPRTLFGIGSNTKVFTATALGMLVEEGQIRWDGRVIDYLPWFQMDDPYVTREMTVRICSAAVSGSARATCSGGRERPTIAMRSRGGSATFRWPSAFAAHMATTTGCAADGLDRELRRDRAASRPVERTHAVTAATTP